MSGHYCETCEGPGNEFCAGPCDDCGRAVHCNDRGRCSDCEWELLAQHPSIAATVRQYAEAVNDDKEAA
jgi:hypothetical protein